MQWQREQVLALAPDTASVKAAQKLTSVGKWPTLGVVEGVALWGECQGSGKTPYRTAIDLSEIAFKCSCPSRKFPCKHALALFLLHVEMNTTTTAAGGPFTAQSTQPDWVESWLAGRAKRKNATQSGTDAPATTSAADTAQASVAKPNVSSETIPNIDTPSPTLEAIDKAKQRRTDARAQKVTAGVTELHTWLTDLVRGGYVEAQSRPYSYWQQMAARLIDAQAPGLAGQVETLGSVIHSGEGWADRLTASIAKLFLLLEAYQRLQTLPEPLQQDVRTLIGWHQSKEEVLASEPVTGQWAVLSHVLAEEGSLLGQRVWLRHVETGQYALILNFAHPSNRQSLDAFWRAGIVVDAKLFYHGGAVPLRAFATDVTVDTTKSSINHVSTGERRSTSIAELQGTNITDALQGYQQKLAQNPWLSNFPLMLANVSVGLHRNSISPSAFVYDQEEHLLPISAQCNSLWQLLSITGGQPTQLFGEWRDDGLLPLALWHEGRYWTL